MEDTTDIQLLNGLSLVHHFEIHFTFLRKEAARPQVDEWNFRETFLNVLKLRTGFKLQEDRSLVIQKSPDARNGRKDDPVATAKLQILGDNGELAGAVLEKMQGAEIRVSGVKLICQAIWGPRTSYMELQHLWEKEFGISIDGYKSKRPGERPDTLVIGGIPSRWLAEPRISSNPSILVTHSILSVLGTIKKVEIVESDNASAVPFDSMKKKIDLVSRLHSNIVVQFEDFESFSGAVRKLVGRAMKMSGKPLVAPFSLTLDTSDYFSERNVRKRKFEKQMKEDAERRMAELATRKAELARLEQERREAEERERVLREEEERLRQEEEEARKVEEERLRLEEEQRMQEEEEARLEEERRMEEERRIEEEERLRLEEEDRVKEEQRRALEEELARVQEQRRFLAEEEEKRESEKKLRARVEETIRGRRQETNRKDHRDAERSGRREGEERRFQSDRREKHFDDKRGRREGQHERGIGKSDEDRWRLDNTQSAASLQVIASLLKSAVEINIQSRKLLHDAYNAGKKKRRREEEDEDDSMSRSSSEEREEYEFYPHRLRSAVIQVIAQ